MSRNSPSNTNAADNSCTYGMVLVLYGHEPEWHSEWRWTNAGWVHIPPGRVVPHSTTAA